MLKLATDIINLSIDCDDLYRDRIKNRAPFFPGVHSMQSRMVMITLLAQLKQKSKCRFAQTLIYHPTSSSYAIDCQRYS